MARIKRNFPVASGDTTVLGHACRIMRRFTLSSANNVDRFSGSFTRTRGDSDMVVEGHWTGVDNHSYGAGMRTRLTNSANTQIGISYGWGYYFGRDNSQDQSQHHFSCYSVFRNQDIGSSHTGALSYRAGHNSSAGSNNIPSSPWAPSRQDDSRGNGDMTGFLQCFEFHPDNCTVIFQ